MLVTILITIYCILAYVVSFKFFMRRFDQWRRFAIFLWLFSPITYPCAMFAEWISEETE